MIYTLTFNPAVDYFITVDNFTSGAVNRTACEKICFGGKGINVSRVLKALGCDSVALGFVGGFTGDAVENFLTQSNIKSDFVKLKNGITRINVKLNDTDINAAGPDITAPQLEALYQKLKVLKSGDILVLSGSVPKTMPQSIYKDIMSALYDKGVKFVVDAEGALLCETLKYKPFLIKPNHHELGAIFDTKIATYDDAFFYAKKLQDMGAQNVMVSMGKKGAVLVGADGNRYTAVAPEGEVISTVGSGDSAVAAFLWAHQNGETAENCLRYAVAAGSATAFSDNLATAEEIKNLF
ncbi:MAG: 1-phosphofructokinase [Clostridia bacterium]|nr:1-phosphofructokinase [Clostridia bacterium]